MGPIRLQEHGLPPGLVSLRGMLRFCAVVELGTGLALMVAPEVVAALLVRGQVTDLAALLGRCMGAALVALGLACWPQPPETAGGPAALRAMFVYSALVALFLGYAGAFAQLAGPLLWPAVALHGSVALLLPWIGSRRPSHE